MKKIILCFMICIFITACGKKEVKLDQSTFLEMKYNAMNVAKEDYKKIVGYLESFSYTTKKELQDYPDHLSITTDDGIITFSFSANGTIQYQNQKITYYAKDTSIKELQTFLEDLEEKYLDDSFYEFRFVKEIKPTEEDVVVKLENTSQYLRFQSTQEIYNLRIHQIEKQGEAYHDIDLLYQSTSLTPNTTFYIRTTIPEKNPIIRIVFETKYHYEVSIIPTYNKEKNELEFPKTFEAKENPS